MTSKNIILGIDTSCDETSVSLIQGKKILANIISSQVDLHRVHGGVVPEIASRAHLQKIESVIDLALESAQCSIKDIAGVAVTKTPGLIGCLLVGLSYAKSIAYSLNIPLTAVHHLKGHLMSAFLEHEEVYPFLGLVVSGGHTALYYVKDFYDIKLIGTTVDDAAGEAYDKVAKLLKLGYPGGPLVDKLAQTGNPIAFNFTRARVKKGPYFMSFSGLKTAVSQYLQKETSINEEFVRNLCASFQKEVAEQIADKIKLAFKDYPDIRALVVAGGVACNSNIRKELLKIATENKVPFLVPSPVNCTDNAAMIAYVGNQQIKDGLVSDVLTLNAQASEVMSAFKI